MATVVYQGSQSCLDNSQLVEARMLRLRLSSPKTHFSQSFELATKATNTIKEVGDQKCFPEEVSHKSHFLRDQQASSNRDSGGWTFFHALYNASQVPKGASNKETTYVPPLVKHSSSRLSDKSLEMCTESLGSETGSDVSGDISLFLSSSCLKEDDQSLTSSGSDTESEVVPENSSASKQKSCHHLSGAKKADSREFPPPLTTMNGSGSLHVRPHREDGRLIIQAIKSPSTRPCFRTERRNGRLRLSLVEDSTVSSSSSGETRENISQVSINHIEEITQNYHVHLDRDHDHEEADDDMESQVEDGNGCGRFEEEEEEETERCELDVEAETGSEDFRRPSRCKEGDQLENQRLLNWEPLWVATS